MYNCSQKNSVANILTVMIITCIVLVSCSQNVGLVTPSTVSPLPAVEPQNTTTSTVQPASQSINMKSLEILNDVPEDIKISGTALIEGYMGDPSYFLNLDDKSEIAMPTGFLGAKVSPDGKRLAYFESVEENKQNLVVTNDFVKKEVIPWEKEWMLDGISTNGNLFIEKKQDNSPPYYVIFDPNTKEAKEILPDYPDIETTFYSPEWWFPVYSPSGNEVVYPRVSSNSRIALWNRTKEQVVTSLTSINNPYGLQPVWSSDGRYFVIALENMYSETSAFPSHELFLVGQNGNIQQLTSLTEFYKDTVRIGSYNWSPDNSQIAFQIVHQEKGQLAVVDTTSKMLTVYDLPGSFVHHEPVWSPDGKFILIDGYFENSEDYWTLLIDLEKQQATRIADNSFPVGWVEFVQ